MADFGLAVRIDNNETHMSGMFQGTLTHMAPEVRFLLLYLCPLKQIKLAGVC